MIVLKDLAATVSPIYQSASGQHPIVPTGGLLRAYRGMIPRSEKTGMCMSPTHPSSERIRPVHNHQAQVYIDKYTFGSRSRFFFPSAGPPYLLLVSIL